MAENPVNNRKIGHKPIDKQNVDVGDSTIFSKKVDLNLWEAASKSFESAKKEDTRSVRHQIFKLGKETMKYKEILSQNDGNKIDFNC